MRLRQAQQLDPAQALKNPDLARILEGNPNLQQTVEKELWDLCEECQRWLWIEAVKHQEELKQKANQIKSLDPQKINGQ